MTGTGLYVDESPCDSDRWIIGMGLDGAQATAYGG